MTPIAQNDSIKLVKDTGMVMQRNNYCTRPGKCKNHPYQPVLEEMPPLPIPSLTVDTCNELMVINQHTLETSTIFNIDSNHKEQIHTFVLDHSHEHEVEQSIILKTEQMAPNPTKESQEKVQYRSSQEVISIVPQKKQPQSLGDYMKYEPMAQGMLLTFMLYVTSVYAVRSYAYWSCMVKDINKVFVS